MNNEREGIRVWGTDNARKIRARMSELKAADNLSLIPYVPPARLHALTENRDGQFSVTVKEPFRIIFEPYHDPVPQTLDGGIDKKSVTQINIIEVVNYHG
ncbi:type II toxin-antitoxin system RelE/ParE family toxin [Paenibacillus sp. FA6]|uniref:type II toxin-antitoxin system RelE/ParE family toxin n=1 Tax=Paenibacillus sp. FA6 TaxID=3413029 RepID=UPI003F65804B